MKFDRSIDFSAHWTGTRVLQTSLQTNSPGFERLDRQNAIAIERSKDVMWKLMYT